MLICHVSDLSWQICHGNPLSVMASVMATLHFSQRSPSPSPSQTMPIPTFVGDFAHLKFLYFTLLVEAP